MRDIVEGNTSQPSQKRPNVSGYGVFVNEKNGWTCTNLGRPTQRVVSTGSSTVKHTTNVTGDLGYKPNGLKWKGRPSVSTNTPLQQRADH
ncbi:hypothetical protein M5689_003338 [Euphorbia peplus]|nr:hypothetical protein M5689_003338 [Euphorbia peplus]